MKRLTISVLLLLLTSCLTSVAQSRSDFPVVVKRFKLTGQTQRIPTTTIFTPRATGMFRVSLVGVETVAANNGAWDIFVDWKGLVSVASTSVHLRTLLLNEVATSATFTAVAGTPIHVSSFKVQKVGGSSYDVFIVIERLTKISSF